ncbi:MAG: sugar ABC transporter permease [Caldilineaceae bacterium]|nr:sugar ABC transporter permease [Caldilineaceae bacterium]MCB0125658.1 sugar ABC transporter permease [Caldilineaceae bacterium]MCB0184925.1 sugar ABC transporter permease [Caldilineaceae bacterium]
MAVATATATRAPKRGMTKRERRNQIMGLLFISPWLIGFFTLALIPLIMSFYYGLTRYDLIGEARFIGLGNYERLFTTDPDFWTVIYNTFYYVLLGVPVGTFVAFLIANLLNTDIRGRALFRSIIYIPAIVPAVCTAMVWLFLLNTQYGAINGVLKALEWKTIPFLSSTDLSKPTLVMIYIWAQGSAVVIYLAALQDVPRSLYEAATVDGANAWNKFWNVTVPLCTPVILFNTVLGFIGAFQEFTLPWLLTGGGPAKSTELYVMNLYRNAFVQLSMGKASAMAWILLVIIVLFTGILFSTSGRWVYYGGEK